MKKQEKNPKPGSFNEMLKPLQTSRVLGVQLSIEQREGIRTRVLGSRMLIYNLTPTRRFGQDVIGELEDLLATVDLEFGTLPPEAE